MPSHPSRPLPALLTIPTAIPQDPLLPCRPSYDRLPSRSHSSVIHPSRKVVWFVTREPSGCSLHQTTTYAIPTATIYASVSDGLACTCHPECARPEGTLKAGPRARINSHAPSGSAGLVSPYIGRVYMFFFYICMSVFCLSYRPISMCLASIS